MIQHNLYHLFSSFSYEESSRDLAFAIDGYEVVINSWYYRTLRLVFRRINTTKLLSHILVLIQAILGELVSF